METARIKHVLSVYANLDDNEATDAQVDKVLVDMYDELTNTRKELSDLRTLHDEAENRRGAERYDLEVKDRVHASQVAHHRDTNVELVRVSTSAFRLVLDRPDACMAAFGEETYQSLKDAFVAVGGDGADLPHPKPVGAQDAD